MIYGLKQEHFAINPKEEFHIFFAREDEFDRFLEDLTATLDSGRIPRYVVFGLFGVGKTHFLLHLKHMISDKTEAVYLETPSAHRRTSFLDFYRTVISALGRGNVIDLLTSGMKKHARLRELGLGEDIAHVVSKAVKDGEQFILWRYLSGEKLKSTEADKLEAVRPALSSEDAV